MSDVETSQGAHGLSARLCVWEKRDYKFKSWKHATPGTVLFAGCAFPSFFPRTLEALQRVCAERMDMGHALDCCGEALAGLLGEEQARIQAQRVQARADERGVTTLVTVCPNCRHALAGHTQLHVRSALDVLVACGVSAPHAQPGVVFVPCPDRAQRTWLSSAQTLLGGTAEPLDTALCCGAAFAIERPEAARKAACALVSEACAACAALGDAHVLYVYCASCAGQLERARRLLAKAGDAHAAALRIVHVASAALDVEEVPAVSSSVLNRAKAALR